MPMDFHNGRVDHRIFHVGLVRTGVEQALEHIAAHPVAEALEHRIPLAQKLRQVAPWAARSRDPQHGFHKQAVVTTAAPAITHSAQAVRLHLRPLGVRQNQSIHPQRESHSDSRGNPFPQQALGWHEGYEVYAAWDIYRHEQDSASPSLQVKEDALQRAQTESLAIYKKTNSESVIIFRSYYLADYVCLSVKLHESGLVLDETALWNSIPGVSDAQISAVTDPERRLTISTITRRYRACDFRRRVLSAYGQTCAICQVQLNLNDAAHIVPVSEPGSTDDTANGLALCKLHHAAYDNGLIEIDDLYRVRLRKSALANLAAKGLDGGAVKFRRALRSVIRLPADKKDWPAPAALRARQAMFS